MTREEAIETLNEIKSLLTFLFTTFDEKEKRERRKEALDMAISALDKAKILKNGTFIVCVEDVSRVENIIAYDEESAYQFTHKTEINTKSFNS